jgi:hypothetical protein
MTLKAPFGKNADMGSTSGMVVAAHLLRLVSVGAGIARCEGRGDGVEAERVMAHAVMAEAARAGRIGDINSAGGAGETVVGESGRVSNSTVS